MAAAEVVFAGDAICVLETQEVLAQDCDANWTQRANWIARSVFECITEDESLAAHHDPSPFDPPLPRRLRRTP